MMIKYLYLAVLIACSNYILMAQTLPDQFDIQFSIHPSTMDEPGYNRFTYQIDPLMAAMVSKQLKEDLKQQILKGVTDNFRLPYYPEPIRFNQDSLNGLLTLVSEYIYFDEDTGEEDFRMDTQQVTIEQLAVNLKFSIGYDYKKNKMYASLLATEFSVMNEENGIYKPVLMQYYAPLDQSVNFENIDYSNMFMDKDFGDQDYNFSVTVPLYEGKGWAVTQKQITHLAFSEAYFDKNPLPKMVYDSDQNAYRVDSTLVRKEIIMIEDEYGDLWEEEILETTEIEDVLVLFNLNCGLNKVMHVESLDMVGYGVMVSWDFESLYQYYWYDKK